MFVCLFLFSIFRFEFVSFAHSTIFNALLYFVCIPIFNVNNGNDLVFSFKFALLIEYFFFSSLFHYILQIRVWYYSWHWCAFFYSSSALSICDYAKFISEAELSRLFASLVVIHIKKTTKLPLYVVLPILWCFFFWNHVLVGWCKT